MCWGVVIVWRDTCVSCAGHRELGHPPPPLESKMHESQKVGGGPEGAAGRLRDFENSGARGVEGGGEAGDERHKGNAGRIHRTEKFERCPAMSRSGVDTMQCVFLELAV